MDRLTLLKALADDSRYAIFEELRRGSGQRSTTELAERLDLHPNTVRLHLERLREAGLVVAETEHHGSVGRPRRVWRLTVHAPSLGLEPGGFRMLAHLLAEAAALGAGDAPSLAAIGRRAGQRRATPAAVPKPAGPDGGVAACRRAVSDGLDDLGFDPAMEGDTVVFTSCPFRELATEYPDLVCALHRGVTEGILAEAAAGLALRAEVTTFSTLVDADPCRAELAFTATP